MIFKKTIRFYEADAGAAAGGAAAAAPAAGAAAAAPAASGDWTSSLNDDNKGYIQNKGFKDPSMLLDSYKGLEKLIGVKERVVLKPEKDDDVAGWDEFYNKSGRPAKSDDYDLALPKDGVDANFTKWAKENFHKAGLNKSQAANLAKAYMEFSGGLANAQVEDAGKVLAEAETSLKREWGAAFDQNKNIAEKALKTFGVEQETVEKLEKAIGAVAMAKLFHGIGSKMGEDTFISGNGGSGNGVLTPEAAMNKISDLRNDKNFVSRFGKGDSDALAEMNRLMKWAYPSP